MTNQLLIVETISRFSTERSPTSTSRKSSPPKPAQTPSGVPEDVFSSVPTPRMKGSTLKDFSKISKKKTKAKSSLAKKKAKLNPVAQLQLQGALAKLKRGRNTLPPKVITPDMYAAPPEEKEEEKVPFKRIRVMHTTTPRTTTAEPVGIGIWH